MKQQSADNLKLFAERSWCVKDSEAICICRLFSSIKDNFDKIVDLGLIYTKLIHKCCQNFLMNSENNINSKNLIEYVAQLHLIARQFLKCPRQADIVAVLGFSFQIISIVKNTLNTEISSCIQNFTAEIFKFLRDNPNIVESLIEQDLFHGLDLSFFRGTRLDVNLSLIDAFKKCISKYFANEQVGLLFADNIDSLNIFEIYTNFFLNDLTDFFTSDLSESIQNEVLQYELFSRFAVLISKDGFINLIIQLCSQSSFIADTRIHARNIVNLLKICLFSRDQESLGNLFIIFQAFDCFKFMFIELFSF